MLDARSYYLRSPDQAQPAQCGGKSKPGPLGLDSLIILPLEIHSFDPESWESRSFPKKDWDRWEK
jgi:hypothetical protein